MQNIAAVDYRFYHKRGMYFARKQFRCAEAICSHLFEAVWLKLIWIALTLMIKNVSVKN